LCTLNPVTVIVQPVFTVGVGVFGVETENIAKVPTVTATAEIFRLFKYSYTALKLLPFNRHFSNTV